MRKIEIAHQATNYRWEVVYNDAEGNCRVKAFTSETAARSFATVLPSDAVIAVCEV